MTTQCPQSFSPDTCPARNGYPAEAALNMATPSHFCSQSAGGEWFVHRASAVPESTLGAMSDVLLLLGAEVDNWSTSCILQQFRVCAGTAIYSEGAVTRSLYVVRYGSFKCFTTAEDGYERVVSFLVGRGNVLGLEGFGNHRRQPMGATALADTSVLVLPLHELDAWCRQSAALDYALHQALIAQLMQAQQAAAMMAAVASDVRLSRFLIWMSQRMAASGQSPVRLVLTMSRRDIASFLAVAHETISRGFGLLTDLGYVRVDNRNVEILDMEGLKSHAIHTRRDTDRARIHATPTASPAVRSTSAMPQST